MHTFEHCSLPELITRFEMSDETFGLFFMHRDIGTTDHEILESERLIFGPLIPCLPTSKKATITRCPTVLYLNLKVRSFSEMALSVRKLFFGHKIRQTPKRSNEELCKGLASKAKR